MAAIDELEAALSLERFARYVAWAGGDRQTALELYTLNTQVSEALYIALHTLEVSLRNRIHTVMSAMHGEYWCQAPGVLLVPHQSAQVADAIADLHAEGKDPLPGRVVAALSFSFWTAMFSPAYEDAWRSGLHAIAAKPDGSRLARKAFSRPLTQVRVLRNRVAHHEPILHWNLRCHHSALRELTGWLSPPAAAWSEPLDRFNAIYPADGLQLARGGPEGED